MLWFALAVIVFLQLATLAWSLWCMVTLESYCNSIRKAVEAGLNAHIEAPEGIIGSGFNFRKGLFRLWIAISLPIFLLAGYITLSSRWDQRTEEAALVTEFRAQYPTGTRDVHEILNYLQSVESSASWNDPLQRRASRIRSDEDSKETALWLGYGIPGMLFAIGWTLLWVLGGFRTPKRT